MQNQAVLDLAVHWPAAEEDPNADGRVWFRRSPLLLIVLLVMAAAIGRDAVNTLRIASASAKPQTVRIALDRLQQVSQMTVDDKSQIIVEGADAEKRNALIPISSQPVEHAQRFLMAAAGGNAYGTALKCLTQAVYYEAGFEPLQGRRAVAQVVLNRVKHPAYPKSVCGVVYQGAERLTGCQFSFTCDGALLRPPAAAAWREAETVAKAALAGYVETSVGTATHYHADYVLPKWAFEMGKIAQLGRHIFYRFPGGWGRLATFAGNYSGIEQIPALNYLALRNRAKELATAAGGSFENGLTVPPEVTDRHAAADVGGRLDVTKSWRLSIPDPVAASSRYREAIDATSGSDKTPAQNAAKEKGPGEATSS